MHTENVDGITKPLHPKTALDQCAQFEAKLADARRALIQHSLFSRVQSASAMFLFMETHIFAVWDFMSLLKTLQIQLTTTRVPWLPPNNREAARLINEIVICEESDEVTPGQFISHFELYLEAMRECGANTLAIDSFISFLARGDSLEQALSSTIVKPHERAFVRSTLNFCTLRPHQVAAAFLYGREDIIPEMFMRLLAENEVAHHREFQTLKVYLERHIHLDGGSHGPLAKKLMQTLCANDPVKWQEAAEIGNEALRARQKLWDGVLHDQVLATNG